MNDEALEATMAAHPAGDASVRLRGDAPTLAQPQTLERPPAGDETLPRVDVDTITGADLRVIETLGEGGMGKVVLASQRTLRRRVAVKLAHADRSSELLHEGVITGMLEHPNIPPIHAIGRDAEGRIVLVMKRIDGVTWADVLADEAHPLRATSPLFGGADPLDAHLEILTQLANALELAHERGVFHRDIKPANVMLGAFGEVYLIDWGIAYHAGWEEGRAPGSIVGTPLYMAPEMVVGGRPDARTDVYLLGATLHEVLTGDPPHIAEHLHASIAHARESPPPTFGPEVPPELAALCRRAMAREPDDRFESARALREAIRDYRSHRASITLCREAQARADELRPLLEEEEPDTAALANLEAEARFGFRQALREWPGNQEARRGLSALAWALAERELALHHPRGARRYLADIVEDQPGMRARIEAAEEAHRRQLEIEERRRERERQLDIRNAHRERIAIYALAAVLIVGLVAWRLVSPASLGDSAARHQQLLTVGLTVAAIMSVAAAVVRRGIYDSELNRRLALSSFAAGGAMIANRITGLVLHPDPAVTLAADLAIFGAVTLAISRAISGLFALAALPFPAGIVLLWRFPERQAVIFNGTLALALSLMVFAFVRARGAAARDSSEG